MSSFWGQIFPGTIIFNQKTSAEVTFIIKIFFFLEKQEE